MKRLRPLPFLFIWLLIVVSGVAQMQTGPLVLFVEASDLQSAELTNLGSAGLSQLADMFRRAGARVQPFDLSEEIPAGTQVVALIRPLRRFQSAHVARLLLYLRGGGNLLLAADPENYNLGSDVVNIQLDRTGLAPLLEVDYGLILQPTFVAEPWFSTDSINVINTNYSLSYADRLPHPVTDPLAAYQLPVWIWGARNIRVEALGVRSSGAPLLSTETAYGETRTDIFRSARPEANIPIAPLEPNLGVDLVGSLNLAALAENDSGSRVAALGDSELLLNGFGLAAVDGSPRYPGNVIFAQRLVGWLMETPVEEWPALPQGFTWLNVDGSSADWSPFLATASPVDDPVGDGAPESSDIQQVRAFSDDLYAYFSVQTGAPASPDVSVDIILESSILTFRSGSAVLIDSAGAATEVRDAAIAFGEVIEMRVPLRAIPLTLRVEDVCVQSSGGADCVGSPVGAPLVNSRAPFDHALVGGPIAIVVSEQPINLRSGPGADLPPVTAVTNGMSFAAIGRDSEGAWINVRSSRYTGWVSAPLVALNGDMSALTVTVPTTSGS